LHLTFTDLAVFIFGTVLVLLWTFLFMKGRGKAAAFEENLSKEDFPGKALFGVGYAACTLLGFDYTSEKDQEICKKLAVLYTDYSVDFYIRAFYAQKMTMALTIACFAAAIYGFSGGSLVLFAFVLGFAGFAYYYYGTILDDKLKKREDEMLGEFSEVVSELALMANAGMILHDAWAKVAYSGESQIHKEMQTSCEEMKNGRPMAGALFAFGQRCRLFEIKKFATTLIQGISKGNADLAAMLKQQNKEVWNAKQQSVRRQGELANSKLLIPIFMVFIGILIMVLVPLFAGMGA